MTESHVFEHSDPTPRVSLAVETHGAPHTDKHYRTWVAKVSAPTVAEALRLLAEADGALRAAYGGEAP